MGHARCLLSSYLQMKFALRYWVELSGKRFAYLFLCFAADWLLGGECGDHRPGQGSQEVPEIGVGCSSSQILGNGFIS